MKKINVFPLDLPGAEVVDVDGMDRPSAGLAVLVVVVSNGVVLEIVDLAIPPNPTAGKEPEGFVMLVVTVPVVFGCPLNCFPKLKPVELCPKGKLCTGFMVACCVVAIVVASVKPEVAGVACVEDIPPGVKPVWVVAGVAVVPSLNPEAELLPKVKLGVAVIVANFGMAMPDVKPVV